MRGLYALLLAFAALFALAGCAAEATAPAAPASHSVSARVRDSLGVPAAGLDVQWIGQFDSGLARAVFGTTDGSGVATQMLEPGAWIVSAGPMSGTGLVAGASFTVPTKGSAADTELVRLELHTASSVSGVVTLAGRTNHAGTIVETEPSAFTVTDSTGAYVLDGMPLGSWTIRFEHFGYGIVSVPATITTPGSSVALPAQQLVLAGTRQSPVSGESVPHGIQTTRSVRAVPAPEKRAR